MKGKDVFIEYLVLVFLLFNFCSQPGFAQESEESAEKPTGDAPERVSGNVIFRDDFTGQTLRPEWKIVAKDPDRLTLIDNEYLLLVTNDDKKNVLSYSGELPENFEAILKVHTPPKNGGQAVRLELRKDDNNLLLLSYWIHRLGAEVHFWKGLKGDWSEFYEKIDFPNDGVYLRLTKKGVEYSGYYSFDGSHWSEVGVHVFMNLDGKPGFDVSNDKKDTPESGVRIDYFEIKQLD